MSSPLDARQRSGETKRQRTRGALITAAKGHFAARGWQATRVEDIARDAGVSVATAFNHFNKQALLGHVYAPLFEPLLAGATADIEHETDPTEALTRHVREFAAICRKHQTLTVALLAAVLEQTVSVSGPSAIGDESDVRNIVPLPKPMIDLIAYGQRAHRFRSYPSSSDAGVYHTNALVLRVMTRPKESASTTATLVLSQMLPALLTDSAQ
ncbi:TetR/AcrR family transcriptional regulator [Nocardia sp. NPDC051052]|uniref:TetR/AcrR family transcriptional regulator n=1 Tax=Nocardia sp. NPDC051052 TaxID=3364322 RepID=UPI0037AA55CC